MSVIGTNLVSRGQSGEFTLVNGEGGRRYTAVYQVKVTSASDGPAIVVAAVGLPTLGDPYSFGNDSDASVTLTSLTPARTDGTRLSWHVVASWETPDRNEGNDNPLEWESEISIGFAQFTEGVQQATNVAAVGLIPPGQLGPIVNSAQIPFDPPPERDSSRLWYRLTKFVADFPWEQAQEYQDAVNIDDFLLPMDSIGLVKKLIAKRTAKMTNIGGSLRFQKNAAGTSVYYWPVTYDIQFKPEGWRFNVLDRGLDRRQEPGDPDGRGGTISLDDLIVFNPDGIKTAKIRDDKGVPLNEPVNFNGQGQPLKRNEPAVYHKWIVYEELPFAALNLQQGL